MIEKINSAEDVKKLNIEEQKKLAEEMRKYILEVVSENGGHLASNLGVVELTIAIHTVFNLPEDKIVWDVGHQTYVHKILTGRKEALKTLRQLNGIAGFPKTNESEYDFFNTGHSSTSISAALGMARARDLKNGNYFNLNNKILFDKNMNILADLGNYFTTYTYNYDAKGRLVSTIDAKGNKTEYIYDDVNRIKEQKMPTGEIITYSYDNNDNI